MSDHQPIQKKHEEFMNDLAGVMDRILNGLDTKKEDKKFAYMVAIFPFGQPPDEQNRFNYISNARREDIIAMMKEMIAKFEGRHIDVKQKEHF